MRGGFIMQEAPEFYTVSQVAEMLQVKRNYIYELIYKGQLQAYRLSEKRFRIPLKEVEKYLESRKVVKGYL
jgi:excisionase family DNA binding protein